MTEQVPSAAAHRDFIDALTRERYRELPRRARGLTEDGPTAQWEREKAVRAVNDEEGLWQEEGGQ